MENNFSEPSQLATIPRLLNPPDTPNWKLYEAIGFPMGTCEQWYLFDIAQNNTELATRIGKGDRLPTSKNPDNLRNAMLGSVPSEFCQSSMTYSPYFQRVEGKSVNQFLFDTLEYLNEKELQPNNLYLSTLPDGAFTFEEWTDTKFRYKAQINDNRYFFYHRVNGISRTGYSNGEETFNMLTITDGMITMMDMIHQAIFRELFNDTQIYTLFQYMPIQINEKQELLRMLNILGASLFPLSLSLLMPVFMYAIVLEKEEKL